MKKILLLCLLIPLIATAFTISLLAAEVTTISQSTEVKVVDRLGILSEEDKKSISPSAQANTHGIKLCLITMQTAYSDDYLTKNEIYTLLDLSDWGSQKIHAVVLVVRMTGANNKFYYDMYTYGNATEVFSDHDVDRILDTDAVYNNLKAGNVKDGAAAFFSLCADEIDGHYKALEAKERRKPLVVVLIAAVVGLVSACGSVLGVVLYYRKKQHGVTYPLDRYAKLNLTQREDRFVGSYVTRVRIQSSSSHGGSRGGGSRGGGGGRRGGR
ncbi:MAG: TPM domain-containing protein [Clostridia bacterium]|nr:TPM domain-containing protein [Clostridia bacterium]